MEYDLAVIGGGSAGYAGARTAAGLGLKTIVVDGAREVGGLCILRGCMPSKTLLESARRFHQLGQVPEFGLSTGSRGFDLGAIQARKRRLVGEFADYRRSQLESGKFEFLRGRAEFTGPTHVRVHGLDGVVTELQAKTFLLATGSEISAPPVPGLADAGCLTSDAMLDLDHLPKSLVVLGAGPVGLEMATFCNAFGTEVTVVQRGRRILSGVDADVSLELERAMAGQGIKFYTGTGLLGVERHGSRTRVVFEHGDDIKTLEVDAVLNALGRKPCLRGFEALGMAEERGRIVVDAAQCTSARHVFAAGDVCGGLEVVHIAIQQAEIAAWNAAIQLGKVAGEEKAMDYRLRLFGVFTDPQLAVCGAAELDLENSGTPFQTATYPFNDHGKSLVMGETAGFVKLIAHSLTGEILGGSVVGPEATELIHEVVVAMRYRASARDFAAIPHYHPTLSEIWTYPAEELAEACGT